MVWGTFLFAKWYRSRISKPFLNRSKFEIFWAGCTHYPTVNVSFLGYLEELKVLSIQFWSLINLFSANRVRFKRSIKKIFTFVKNRLKNDICYLNFENFFSKKIFCLKLSDSKRSPIFFRFAKIFQFFVVAPLSNFLKFLKKLNFSMTTRSWAWVMGTVIFSKRSSFRKANNF